MKRVNTSVDAIVIAIASDVYVNANANGNGNALASWAYGISTARWWRFGRSGGLAARQGLKGMKLIAPMGIEAVAVRWMRRFGGGFGEVFRPLLFCLRRWELEDGGGLIWVDFIGGGRALG